MDYTTERAKQEGAMSGLTRYQAYELVQMEDRTILTAPAPGLPVYLAADVEEAVKRAAALTQQLATVTQERDEWHVNATHHYEAEKILEQQLTAANAEIIAWKHSAESIEIVKDERDKAEQQLAASNNEIVALKEKYET
jgi:thymidylate kinase